MFIVDFSLNKPRNNMLNCQWSKMTCRLCDVTLMQRRIGSGVDLPITKYQGHVCMYPFVSSRLSIPFSPYLLPHSRPLFLSPLLLPTLPTPTKLFPSPSLLSPLIYISTNPSQVDQSSILSHFHTLHRLTSPSQVDRFPAISPCFHILPPAKLTSPYYLLIYIHSPVDLPQPS